MRKWEHIVSLLKKKEAPIRVINAAKEIDDALLSLGLDDSQVYGPIDDSWESIDLIVNDRNCCPACTDCDCNCNCCALGNEKGCTPRDMYADNYFRIVNSYVRDKARKPSLI